MRFLADMGVALRVVEWLRREGHNVTHLRERGLHRLPDADVFRLAAAEDRAVLTFDLDFGEIIALSGPEPIAVVLFRLHNTRTQNVIERLDAVLAQSAAALTPGTVVVVEDSRHRIRRFPGTR